MESRMYVYYIGRKRIAALLCSPDDMAAIERVGRHYLADQQTLESHIPVLQVWDSESRTTIAVLTDDSNGIRFHKIS